MIAASGPPARQPLLGDGNHLIESLLGPRCERIVTCSRHGKVFPLRTDFLPPATSEKKFLFSSGCTDYGMGINRWVTRRRRGMADKDQFDVCPLPLSERARHSITRRFKRIYDQEKALLESIGFELSFFWTGKSKGGIDGRARD